MKRKLVGMLAAVLLLAQGCAAAEEPDGGVPVADKEEAAEQKPEIQDVQPETETQEGEDMAEAANKDKEAKIHYSPQGYCMWDNWYVEKDGEIHRFDLCEECYDELLRGFRIPVQVEETREFL